MFNQARLKLTIWYVVVTMMVSILFSLLIFKSFSFEFERNLRRADMIRQAEQMNIVLPETGPIPKRIEQQFHDVLEQEGLPPDLQENLSQ